LLLWPGLIRISRLPACIVCTQIPRVSTPLVNGSFSQRYGRIYVNQLARSELDWQPKYDFPRVLDCLRENRDSRSALARDVGSKGYHDRTFDEGPYPVA